MAVTPSFRTFVIEQLSRVTPGIRERSMFGGVGVYAGDFFFALIDDDIVYLKVDDSNRADFEARGFSPFRPAGPGGEVMQYYALGEDLLDAPDELRPWVEKSIAVARQKKIRKSPRRKRSTTKRKKAP